MILLLNRAAQLAVFSQVGEDQPTVHFADDSEALAGYVTFRDAFPWAYLDPEEEWHTGLLVTKDSANWALYEAIYSSGTGEIIFTLHEDWREQAQGSLAHGDVVTVMGVPTAWTLSSYMFETVLSTLANSNAGPPGIGTVALGNVGTWALESEKGGMLVRATASNALTITLPLGVSRGWYVHLVREGTGALSIAPPQTETLNGGTAAIAVSTRWREVTCYKVDDSAWTVVNA
jgi:hypothetical protein